MSVSNDISNFDASRKLSGDYSIWPEFLNILIYP